MAHSAFEENSYLVDRIKHLENLMEEMVASNQEVIDEAVITADDYKLRVNEVRNKVVFISL